MPRVELLKRWADRNPGEQISVSNARAAYLIKQKIAKDAGNPARKREIAESRKAAKREKRGK